MKELKTTEKLPKAFKAKWVKALRSGKFKQGKNSLLNVGTIFDKYGNEKGVEKTYCCLGVAACVAGYSNKKLDGEGLLNNDRDWRKVPALLREKPDDTGEVNPITKFLSGKNDLVRNWKFDKIATWIDKNL